MTRKLLTDREKLVLELAMMGWGTAEISRHAGVSKPAISQIKAKIIGKGYSIPAPFHVKRERKIDDVAEALAELYVRRVRLNDLIATLEDLQQTEAAA